jgi:myo-inositol-1-phosphate synthase
LAAPLVLDLALFLDLAQRAKKKGIQEWLSFYFKSPMSLLSSGPENDLFLQLTMLRHTLKRLMKPEMASVTSRES